MLLPFYSATKACAAEAEIFRAGLTPSAMEFMERDAIDFVLLYNQDINIKISALFPSTSINRCACISAFISILIS